MRSLYIYVWINIKGDSKRSARFVIGNSNRRYVVVFAESDISPIVLTHFRLILTASIIYRVIAKGVQNC